MSLVTFISLLLWFIPALALYRNKKQFVRLESVELAAKVGLPTLSVVIPARNEEITLRQALRSLLEQDYPGLQVIVVNDRSTDATAQLLTELQSPYPHLHVVTIEQLPAGWLGKCHAMHRGAALAKGRLLLFSDADVCYAPAALQRAVTHFNESQSDFLTLMPRCLAQNRWEELLLSAFWVVMGVGQRFWAFLQESPRRPTFMGIGAFMLMRREHYHAIGGHEPLRMEVIDDLGLGYLMRQAGYRLNLAFALEDLSLRWFVGIGGLVRGLEKNAFAALGYHYGLAVFGVPLLAVVGLWPFVQLILPGGLLVKGMALGALLCLAAIYRRIAFIAPWWHFLSFFGATLLMLFIVWRSAFLAWRQGGIRWRDTFYPIEQLRTHMVFPRKLR